MFCYLVVYLDDYNDSYTKQFNDGGEVCEFIESEINDGCDLSDFTVFRGKSVDLRETAGEVYLTN